MKKDLGPLSSLIPQEYKSYFDIASKTTSYRIKETVQEYIQSAECEQTVRKAIDTWLDSLMDREVNDIFKPEARAAVYRFFDQQVHRMFYHPAMDSWLDKMIREKVYQVLADEKSLEDILPGELSERLVQLVSEQTPYLM